MKVQLTDLTIRSLREGMYFDTKTPAFGIRIGKQKKTWLVVKGRTRTQIVLGHYPDLSLSAARSAAKIALAGPQEAKENSPTFATVRTEHLDSFTGKPSTLKEKTRLLTKHFKQLDDKELHTITDRDVSKIIDGLKPSEGLHAFRAVRAMFRWAVRPPRRYIKHSPLEGMAPEARDGRKTRILSDEEVKTLLRASCGVSGAIVRLMLLWGTRKGETIQLRRDWIAGDVLTIPAHVTKNGRPHTIPLLPYAKSILEEQKGNGAYFFPSRYDPNQPIHTGSWTKLHRELMKETGTSGWTAHDCRRTFRSACARFGVSRDLAERLLNHAQDTLDEIYVQYDWLDEKKAALSTVENWLKSLSVVVSE